VFDSAADRFAATPSKADGLLLSTTGQISYSTLVLGSALALFLYPHVMTAFLAAKDRATVRRSIVGLPVYTLLLGIIALFGYMAIAEGIAPVGGDRNTIMPALFDAAFPGWVTGTAFAAIVVGAFVPAAIMSIAAANLFTRNIYKEFMRPNATPAEETRVSKFVSLATKFGAVAIVAFFAPAFSLDLQLIGGVIILQTLPPVAIGLYSTWMHRWALMAGLVVGLGAGIVLLYQIPQLAPNGSVARAHFGGSAWPLSHLGISGGYTIYAGLIALALNLAVAVVATPVLRLVRAPEGHDITWRRDYNADEAQSLHRLEEILDGRPVERSTSELPALHAMPERPELPDRPRGNVYRSRYTHRGPH
jgi:SSS family solute:Na+ symporter